MRFFLAVVLSFCIMTSTLAQIRQLSVTDDGFTQWITRSCHSGLDARVKARYHLNQTFFDVEIRSRYIKDAHFDFYFVINGNRMYTERFTLRSNSNIRSISTTSTVIETTFHPSEDLNIDVGFEKLKFGRRDGKQSYEYCD